MPYCHGYLQPKMNNHKVHCIINTWISERLEMIKSLFNSLEQLNNTYWTLRKRHNSSKMYRNFPLKRYDEYRADTNENRVCVRVDVYERRAQATYDTDRQTPSLPLLNPPATPRQELHHGENMDTLTYSERKPALLVP